MRVGLGGFKLEVTLVSPGAIKLLMAVLVACFAVQTVLVYTDEKAEPLSEHALGGRRLWHQHNCQACHQLYGQGGFLGPDLTNFASRMNSTRMKSLLTVGSGQMPPFDFDDDEISQMTAFLDAMDQPELGRGQLRLGRVDAGLDEATRFAQAVGVAMAPDSPEARGFTAYSGRACTVCHQPFRKSIVGAPDLALAAGQMTAEDLRTILTDGRPLKGMPPPTPNFSEDEINDVIAYLTWLHSSGDDVRVAMTSEGARGSIDWGSIPWWTFQ